MKTLPRGGTLTALVVLATRPSALLTSPAPASFHHAVTSTRSVRVRPVIEMTTRGANTPNSSAKSRFTPCRTQLASGSVEIQAMRKTPFRCDRHRRAWQEWHIHPIPDLCDACDTRRGISHRLDHERHRSTLARQAQRTYSGEGEGAPTNRRRRLTSSGETAPGVALCRSHALSDRWPRREGTRMDHPTGGAPARSSVSPATRRRASVPEIVRTALRPEGLRVGRVGFEPTKALPADLQSAPVGHLGTDPQG